DLACQDAQQRRFARAIHTHHTDDITRSDREVETVKKGAVCIATGQAMSHECCCHPSSLFRTGRSTRTLPRTVIRSTSSHRHRTAVRSCQGTHETSLVRRTLQNFLHHTGFQLHLTESWHLRVDVVIAHSV